jgi:hypothetical protein
MRDTVAMLMCSKCVDNGQRPPLDGCGWLRLLPNEGHRIAKTRHAVQNGFCVQWSNRLDGCTSEAPITGLVTHYYRSKRINHMTFGRLKYLGTATVLLGVTVTSQAALNIKAGLWEMQMQNSLNGKALPDMSQIMAKMPPEARQKMEAAMMNDNGGIRFGANGNMRHCLTAAQIARDDLMVQDPKNPCAINVVSRSDRTLNVSIQCSKPKGYGSAQTVVDQGIRYTTTSDLTLEQQGQPMRLQSTVKGTWLGADCNASPASTRKK